MYSSFAILAKINYFVTTITTTTAIKKKREKYRIQRNGHMSFVQLFNSQIKVSIKPGQNTILNVQLVFLNLFIINIQKKNARSRVHNISTRYRKWRKKAKSMNLNIRGKKNDYVKWNINIYKYNMRSNFGGPCFISLIIGNLQTNLICNHFYIFIDTRLVVVNSGKTEFRFLVVHKRIPFGVIWIGWKQSSFSLPVK